MKEYFMTDVKLMLQQCYGRLVPKFLGEFMKYVSELSYDERPDYRYCKYIFEKAFISNGYQLNEMSFNPADLRKHLKPVVERIDADLVKNAKNLKTIMQLGMFIPFQQSIGGVGGSGPNKVSPKNLRSKKGKGRAKKSFSWADILSTDPDMIARQRAEKEFEKEPQTPITPRYTGRPTYAIIEIENRLRLKEEGGRDDDGAAVATTQATDTDDFLIKGYTKPMMDIVRKQQAEIKAQLDEDNNDEDESVCETPVRVTNGRGATAQIRRAGLRRNVKPTRKSLLYKKSIEKKKINQHQRRHTKGTSTDEESPPNSRSSSLSKQRSSSQSAYSRGSINSLDYTEDDDDDFLDEGVVVLENSSNGEDEDEEMELDAEEEDDEEEVDDEDDDEPYNPIIKRRIRHKNSTVVQSLPVVSKPEPEEDSESESELKKISEKPSPPPRKRGRPRKKSNFRIEINSVTFY